MLRVLRVTFSPNFTFNCSPNVCVERTEEDLKGNSTGTTENTTTSTSLFDHSMHINSCTKSPENDAYACVTEIKRPDLHRKYTVKYSCCYGFTRDGDTLGCTKGQRQKMLILILGVIFLFSVIPMTTILDTLNSLKLTDLVQSLKESGLSSLLEAGNFTIFAPTNEAFEDYKRSVSILNVVADKSGKSEEFITQCQRPFSLLGSS